MRGSKQNPYSQDKLILQVLKRGGEYFEVELGKIISGKPIRGARSLIHTLREKGATIASKNMIWPIQLELRRKHLAKYSDLPRMSCCSQKPRITLIIN